MHSFERDDEVCVKYIDSRVVGNARVTSIDFDDGRDLITLKFHGNVAFSPPASGEEEEFVECDPHCWQRRFQDPLGDGKCFCSSEPLYAILLIRKSDRGEVVSAFKVGDKVSLFVSPDEINPVDAVVEVVNPCSYQLMVRIPGQDTQILTLKLDGSWTTNRKGVGQTKLKVIISRFAWAR